MHHDFEFKNPRYWLNNKECLVAPQMEKGDCQIKYAFPDKFIVLKKSKKGKVACPSQNWRTALPFQHRNHTKVSKNYLLVILPA